mmetsp:Transcript_120767/g.313555  ORF Transcript_120767/g.313555 Transcript_120767/m.313555 type:complete len:248 (+) Transcript_120767:990-1733(+)
MCQHASHRASSGEESVNFPPEPPLPLQRRRRPRQGQCLCCRSCALRDEIVVAHLITGGLHSPAGGGAQSAGGGRGEATVRILQQFRRCLIKQDSRHQCSWVSPPLIDSHAMHGTPSSCQVGSINRFFEAFVVDFTFAIGKRVLQHLLNLSVGNPSTDLTEGLADVLTGKNTISVNVHDEEDLHELISISAEGLVKERVSDDSLGQLRETKSDLRSNVEGETSSEALDQRCGQLALAALPIAGQGHPD